MRTIVLLSAASSVHTVRWANALEGRGYRVHVISCHRADPGYAPTVTLHALPYAPPFGYVRNRGALRRLLAEIRPDLVHTFFATGYGTLARLAAVHPHVLTVLGSDVLLFPTRSPLHRRLIVGNLATADLICATGRHLSERTRKLSPATTPIEIVPFGVDTNAFRPHPEAGEANRIEVGSVKALSPTYGMDVLIRAFSRAHDIVHAEDPELARRLHLRIVGGGRGGDDLRRLVARLDLGNRAELVGPVPHERVAAELGRLDVFVAPSRSESFGVAVLEASACGLPVVVSNAGGLPEVVRDGVTGRIVPVEDVEATAAAIVELVRDEELRRRCGEAGRAFVQERFEWDGCVSLQEQAYARCLGRRSSASG